MVKIECYCTYFYFFHNEGPYQKETSPMICRAYQWTGSYMIGISAMKELNDFIILFVTPEIDSYVNQA